jgi:hypothetical protein
MLDFASTSSWWNSILLDIVLIGIAGIVVWHLIPGRHANGRLIVQIAFFLAMSALLLDGQIVPYESPSGTETLGGAILVAFRAIVGGGHQPLRDRQLEAAELLVFLDLCVHSHVDLLMFRLATVSRCRANSAIERR